MYLTAERLEEGQAGMTCDFTNKSALLVEVHALKVGLICGEDLVGFWDHPDLEVETMVSGRT